MLRLLATLLALAMLLALPHTEKLTPFTLACEAQALACEAQSTHTGEIKQSRDAHEHSQGYSQARVRCSHSLVKLRLYSTKKNITGALHMYMYLALLCLLGKQFLQYFISVKDGPEKRTETRQRWMNARRQPYICCVFLQMLGSLLDSFISFLFLGSSFTEMKFYRNFFPGLCLFQGISR